MGGGGLLPPWQCLFSYLAPSFVWKLCATLILSPSTCMTAKHREHRREEEEVDGLALITTALFPLRLRFIKRLAETPSSLAEAHWYLFISYFNTKQRVTRIQKGNDTCFLKVLPNKTPDWMISYSFYSSFQNSWSTVSCVLPQKCYWSWVWILVINLFTSNTTC